MDIADELMAAHAEHERQRLRVVKLSEQLQRAFAKLADATARLNETKARAAAGGDIERKAA